MSDKILICEDERFIHELIQTTLQDGGIETLSAYTGAEAISFVSQERPQMILLDMMLPDMDGAQILSTLRAQEEDQHTPVIVLSATPREELEAKLADFSVTDYLSKPFNPGDLLARVQKATTGIPISSSDQPSILVVEDSHIHQKLVGRFLEDSNFQPIFAESVKQAIQILSTFTPQAIILDLHFPKGSGLEVLEELKTRGEKTPVIVMSGIIDKKTLDSLSGYKVKAVMAKPLAVSRLKEELGEIFGNPTETSKNEGATTQEIQILLVEDFLLTMRTMEKTLTDMGFRVVPARDGNSALRLLASNRIDIIALDVGLPGMNGVEFLGYVRRRKYETPCVVISGNLSSKSQDDLQRLGVTKFFSKPLNYKEFSAYVNGLLRGTDPSAVQASSYDVLIAISSEQVAHLVEDIVTSMGHTTMVVNDGFLALAELPAKPKLVIFDNGLKGVDCSELARQAGPLGQREVRLLVLAEYLNEGMEKDLKELGIDAVLSKPFQREKLMHKVTEFMAGSSLSLPLASFADEFQRLLDELPQESADDYWPTVCTLGHNLRGSAMYVGRSDLASLGQQIEEAVGGDDKSTAKTALDEVQRIFKEIRKDLEKPASSNEPPPESSDEPPRSDEVIVE